MSNLDNVGYLYFAAYICPVLGSLGGVGGGGMLVPIFALFGGVDVKDAIVLSIITITGNALIRGLYFGFKKHSKSSSRYLANYELIKLAVLTTGNVSFLGTKLNQWLPNIVIVILIFVVLALLIVKMSHETYKLFRNKSDDKSDDKSLSSSLDKSGDKSGEFDEESIPTNSNCSSSSSSNADEQQPGESKKYIFDSLLFVLFGMLLIVFFTFMINSYDETSKIWLLWFIQFVLVLMLCFETSNSIRLRYRYRELTNFNFLEGDILWKSWKDFVKFGTVSSVVGVLSTLLGIGGGMIFNPIVIHLGIKTDVVLATSSIIGFFATTIAAIQYLAVSYYIDTYGYSLLIFYAVGLASGITSMLILKFLKKKIKKIITVVLLISLVFSLILLMIHGIKDIVDNGIN